MPVSTSWRPWLTACTTILATGAAGTLWAQDQRPELTGDSAVVVQITGVGPTGTRYLDPHADPTRESSDTSH
jgi:hypothetical protein